MAKDTIKLKILGINRCSDDNLASDVSCFEMVNLEYVDGCYRPVMMGAVGNVRDKGGSNVSVVRDYEKIWLHYLSDNTINWIGLKSNGRLDYMFKTGRYDDSVKNEDGLFATVSEDTISPYKIYDGATEDNVTFVGNFLVVNDILFNGMDDYRMFNLRSLYIRPTYKRKGEGFYVSKYFEAETLYDDIVDDEASRTICLGALNEMKAKANEDGYFQGYAFVRCGVKMYDGSYVMITNPVMISTGANSDLHSRYSVSGLKYNSETNQLSFINTDNGIFGNERAANHQDIISYQNYFDTIKGCFLEYTKLTEPKFHNSWSRYNDFYVTEKSGASVKLSALNVFELMFLPDIFQAFDYTWKEQAGELKVTTVSRHFIMKASKFKCSIDTNITQDLEDFITSVDIFMTKPVSVYKENEMLYSTSLCPMGKDDDDIKDEILASLNTFYKVKELKLDELGSEVDILDDVDVTSDVFVSRETLQQSAQYYDYQKFDKQSTYNSAVHSIAPTVKLSSSIAPFKHLISDDFSNLGLPYSVVNYNATALESTLVKYKYNSKLYNITKEDVACKRSIVKIDKETYAGTSTVKPDSMDGLAELGLGGVIAIVASNANTEYACLRSNGDFDTDKMKYCVKTSEKYGNYSLFFRDNFKGYISNERDCMDSSSSVFSKTNDTSKLQLPKNILKVSKTNNPTYYPDAQTYTIGNGEIIGVCANTIELSQGMFGAYPLYVFTTEGIFAMAVDTTGERMYNTVAPVSKEVCVNANTICGTDYGVVFASENGLCIISGTVVRNISVALKGALFDYMSEKDNLFTQILDSWKITRLRDEVSFDGNKNSSHSGDDFNGEFLSYLKDGNTHCIYNKRKSKLIIYNNSEDPVPDTRQYKPNRFSYVMDVGGWSVTKVQSYIKSYVEGYPEGYFMMRDIDRLTGGASNSPNMGVVYSGGGVLDTNLFKIGDTNFAGSDYFVMPSYTDVEGNDFPVFYNNHYADVCMLTRPIKMDSEDFKGSYRVVVRGLFHNYFDIASRFARSVVNADKEYPADTARDTEPLMRITKEQFFHGKWNERYGVSRALGLYVFASNDCRKWHLVGACESANIVRRDIGCTVHHGGYKYMMACVAGRLKDNSRIDYIEIQAKERYENKLR